MKHGSLAHRATQILPGSAASALSYIYVKHVYASYMRRKFGDRFMPSSPGPVAPPELIETEALMREGDLRVRMKPEWYFGSGYRGVWTVLTTLEQYGGDPARLRSVLEFGCGSARVLRHFRDIVGLALAGADANLKAIEWDRQNLPGIVFSHNGLQPPLAFADGSFDLVYALSVFTHIPLQWQRSWLDDLRRVLRPGGHLICTVHGRYHIDSMLSDQDRAKLQQEGSFTLNSESAQASYSSQVLGSWDVFQTRDEVRAAFGVGFELLSYTAHDTGQDMLTLRKSARPA